VKECVVYGIRSPYVYELNESLLRLKIPVAAFVDNVETGVLPKDLQPIVRGDALYSRLTDLPVAFPLTTPGHRQSAVNESTGRGFSHFATVNDPTSVIASTATFEEGLLTNGMSIVGAKSVIGRFVIINRGVSIGHHVSMDDFVTLGPGCVICGLCTIGKGAFVGSAAVVNPRLSIGSNAVIGSGAVVTRDVPDNCLVVGNPARIVKEDIRGYNDISVT
jgi:sugar O-acyltransferase (sialic acid O-acetyltransferase NeuD family)